MAYPASRSMNADLAAGLSDGRYKKVNPDRGGVVESTTIQQRAGLDDLYYGFHEAPVKILPDGSVHGTPYYASTPTINADTF